MRKYKPRRASKRWLDADCPEGVLAIFDNKKFCDRYTVIYAEVITNGRGDEWLWGRSMSPNPFHPQGVGISFELAAHQAREFRYRESHRAYKWSSLPEKVKECVKQDLREEV